MKKILITVILLTGILFAGMAQKGQRPGANMPPEGILKGSVFEKSTSVPIEYANVILRSKRDSALVTGGIVKNDGSFLIKDIPYGRYYVIIKFIGFEKKVFPDVKITPRNKLVDLGRIELVPADNQIEEVSVVADRNYVEYKIDKKVINVSQHLNAEGGSAADVLDNVPSVEVDIEGNVTLRGSSNFTVLIDGKPTVLDANDVLQQTPASAIKSIEIITNPSAKYDPDGTAGIINIIMKKNNKKGVNGIINTSLGTGDKYSADFLFNIRNNKINFFIGGNYRDYNMLSDLTIDRESYLQTDTVLVNENDKRTFARKGMGLKTGFDYYISDKTSLSFSADLGRFGMERNFDSKYHTTYNAQNIETYTTGTNYTTMGYPYYKLNLNFMHKFDDNGHTLSGYAYYSQRNGGSVENISNTITDENYDPIAETVLSRTGTNGNTKIARAQIDYVRPIGSKAKLEAGLLSRYYSKISDYTYEDYVSGNWQENQNYTNSMTFDRYIESAYVTFSGEIAGFGVQAGLRGEYTNRVINQLTTGDVYSINRFDFFPTAHITKTFGNDNQLQLSYSRRINRPREFFLNPFVLRTDEFNRSYGNPDLQPEYINSVELNYQKGFGRSFISIETYYRQTNNMMTRIHYVDENNIMIHTMTNLNKDYSIGVEIMSNLFVKRWWNVNASGSFYKYAIEGEILDEDIATSSYNWRLRLNNTFIITPMTKIQLSGSYRGPSVTAQGSRDAMWFANLALRQDLFKRKLTVTFNVRDVFGTMKRDMTMYGTTYYSHIVMDRESPIFTLGISYKINNYRQTERRRRNGDDTMELDDF